MSMTIFSPLILYQPTLVFKRTDPSGSDLVLLRPLLLLCIIHRIQSQISNFHLFIIEKEGKKVSQNSCFCTVSHSKGSRSQGARGAAFGRSVNPIATKLGN